MREEEERLQKEIAIMYSQLPQINENLGLNNELGRMLLNRNLSISDFETYKLEIIFLRQDAGETLNQWISFINQLDYTRRRLFALTKNVNWISFDAFSITRFSENKIFSILFFFLDNIQPFQFDQYSFSPFRTEIVQQPRVEGEHFGPK